MKDKIDILREAIGTGELVKIKYFGGSQPGTVREIMPRKIDNDKDIIYAYCLVSDRVLSFSLPKIEIASESDAVNYTFVEKYIDFQNVPTWVQTLKELQDNYKGDLEKLGWFVKIGEKSIELSANGKERIIPDICIYFENEEDRERPWIVKCRGRKTTSFEHEESAVEKFLKHCSKYKPEQKDDPKQPQQPSNSVEENNKQPSKISEADLSRSEVFSKIVPKKIDEKEIKTYYINSETNLTFKQSKIEITLLENYDNPTQTKTTGRTQIQSLNLVEAESKKSGCGLYCLLLLLSCVIFLGNILF